MSKDMLGTVVRKLVTLPAASLGIVCDLLEKLADQEWTEALKRFLRKENPWDEAAKVVSSLELVTTVVTPAIATFRALDHFKVDTAGEVKIGYLGDNFCRFFLSGDGKIETDIVEATLRVHRLAKSSVDGPIIAELGGEHLAETTLAQMWELMKAQGHGQRGNLLANYANIFYIRDANGVLWAVSCRWYSARDSWFVSAAPRATPCPWGDDSQVVSR